MADNRIDRELEKRERTPRKQAWRRPELLPSPSPEAGYTFHWVRVSTRGQADAINVSSKLREGWEPVRAVDHPEIFLSSIENERFKDNVVIGGLLLCKAPTKPSLRCSLWTKILCGKTTRECLSLMREKQR